MMRTIGILATAAIVAAGAILLIAAFLYPVDRQVGGVNELTFTRTGGFIGLNEKLHIKENGTAEYTSDKFGNTTIHLDKTEVADLLNRTSFFTADKTYNPIPGAADYFIYGLDVQRGFNVTTIQWVDSGAANETLPPQLLDIQSQIENIILRARNITTTPGATEQQQQAADISKDFIIHAPTFKFDGMNETLRVIDTKILESFPEQYVTTLTFDSRFAGYGNRTGQVLAQVITPHTAVVTVVNNTVTSAIIDGKWDELKQKPVNQPIVLEPEQALNLAMTYIKEKYPDAAKLINGSSTWNATRTTPGGLLGHETYIYEGGNWKATMEWSIVAPEYLTYKITAQHTSGITWTGEVHGDQVTETSYKTG